MNAFLKRGIGAERLRATSMVWICVAMFVSSAFPAKAQDGDQPAAVPAPAVTQESWSPDALEELLAPIALYPDPLLSQVLAASVNSQEVLDCGGWLVEHQDLTGDALDKEAEKAGFGPSMRALVQFPTVVDMMCQQIDWTQQIGAAFTSDQKAVLDAVQRLRLQAKEVGNLQSSKEQTVETKTEGSTVIVEVQPADPQVIYVPTYDPESVYTTPPPADDGSALMGAIIGFGVGIAVGAAMDNSYCYPSWGMGCVYYGPRPFYPPAYMYRPVYGPMFPPARGYYPPPGYRYGYNNVNVNNTIVVNNNNYYNRFENNKNLNTGGSKSPLGVAEKKGTLGKSSTTARAQSRKGTSTSGAKAGNLGAAGSGTQAKAGTKNLGGTGGTKAGTSKAAGHVDKGYGGSSRDATAAQSKVQAAGGADAVKSKAQASGGTGAAKAKAQSAGGADAAKQKAGTAHASGGSASKSGALSGASQGSGSFERSASARGKASTGGSAHAASAKSAGRAGHR